jgi:hypothetical protein
MARDAGSDFPDSVKKLKYKGLSCVPGDQRWEPQLNSPLKKCELHFIPGKLIADQAHALAEYL